MSNMHVYISILIITRNICVCTAILNITGNMYVYTNNIMECIICEPTCNIGCMFVNPHMALRGISICEYT